MKKLILTLIAALGLAAGAAHAAGGETIAWDKAPNKTNDLASLQNGAKLFVNYCLSCHSAAFMRFNRLRDIGLTEQQIKDNLLFTTEKVGETMKAAIDPKQAKDWFGANPPDLTVIARSRSGHGGTGADYLYTFLRTFYRDETKATGWNNLAFPNVGMPHVLWELQGERRPVFEAQESHGQRPRCSRAGSRLLPARHDSTAVRSGRWRPGELPAVDGRASAEHPRSRGCVGADFPGHVHRHCLAPERGVLERRQVKP
jgi:ubiquinol-cytochrome c reductase cytochrome c1 subunit